MQILYYAHVDLSGVTGSPGSTRHVLEVVNGLSRRGHDITLVVPEPDGPLPDCEANRVLTFPSGPGVMGFISSVIYCSWLILRFCLLNRPDCVYGREMIYTAHSAFVARLARVPHIVEVNGFQPEHVPSRPDFPSYRYPALILFEALTFWLSTGLVTVSDGLRQRIIKTYSLDPECVRTIHNGVDTDTFHPADNTSKKGEADQLSDPPRVGFLGHLFPWSGVETLIRAIPLVLDRYPSCRFVIVGDGASLVSLKELADRFDVSSAVEFTGRIPRKRVPDYLQNWTIGVSPYTDRRDSIDSLKTYEYMACGLPAVVSDRPELADLIRSYDCGLVFEADDESKLADCIGSLLRQPERREAMARRGRRAAVENHSWERTVDRTNAWLNELTHHSFENLPDGN